MSTPAEIVLADDPPEWLVDETGPNIIQAPNRTTQSTAEQMERNIVSADYVAASPNNNTNNNYTNGAITGSAADAASNKTWKEYFQEGFVRDRRLLLITLCVVICMNIPWVKWALYPFTIYSTWIHEFCHGMAAIILGGEISKLQIFPDTSGLAYTAIPSYDRRGFVASAGYQGTAIIGFLLLVFRRTKRGPRTGTMIIALTMILTCILYIRNAFGLAFLSGMGIVLLGLAVLLPSSHIRNLYTVLAVTCSMNAITSVHDLFGSNHVVNGQASETDAHTMAEVKGGSYVMWAILWLVLACVLTLLGIVFAIPGPGEVPDFKCCGKCQDCGCFTLCNLPGLRVFGRMRRGCENDTTDNNQSV
mmetsp:Transcript_3283/g.9107  ORF Transcript_3283/g.9107 Transcript_3283/m.9107 type:complete len:361 (-) Transcript_3283:150-1232(-)|eukprot:CAMPEP_0172367912 /NCGR_PEP_ID=MMETSP1060-20121228/24542_1 /TAXON_ID=37318 /ORGANISM="Pseudo-nitzschia pungens, Strain cf. cingulata" /LENGTH=360 /DNA_ID=CAMNT_0013092333 /DNA_START=146 /DNA_END=1228 /DNA_ORIENTATION=-